VNYLSTENEPTLFARGAARIKQAVVSTAIAAFFGALIVTGLGSPNSAYADEHIIEYHNEDGSVMEFYKDENGNYWAWITWADGEQTSYTFDDNPNPEDPNGDSGAMTPEKLKALIEKYAGEMSAYEEEFWSSFFGKYLADKDLGIVPVHNPSPIAYDFEGEGGGLGFDPNGGNIVDQLGDPKGDPDNPNDGEDREDYGTETPPSPGMFEDDMPGPPELINPNPTLRDETTVGDPFVGDPVADDDDDDDDDELVLELDERGFEVQP
jgi:YD repeat-containing protein